MTYYKRQIKSYNNTAHNILKNVIDLILPQIHRKKLGIITTIVSSFIGLAYEGISISLCDILGNSGFQVNWCHLGN